MPDYKNKADAEDELLPPSKSALKRQMTALQQLGESLVALSDKQLQNIPIEEDGLKIAIAETKRISSNSARRRHMQYIGKLMRNIDPAPIEAALNALYASRQASTDSFHELEEQRDLILAEGDKGIQEVMECWPMAERQQLRQLLLQHQREQQTGKPPAASRKLFRYLRELQEAAD
jgi:ribosome-associated protein